VRGARPPSVVRGEIWLVNLDPTIEREIRKTRPVVIVSPPEIHDYLDTIIVAPITSSSSPAPYRIETHLPKKLGRIVLDQIRTIDKLRLVRRMTALDPTALERCLQGLRELFDP